MLRIFIFIKLCKSTSFMHYLKILHFGILKFFLLVDITMLLNCINTRKFFVWYSHHYFRSMSIRGPEKCGKNPNLSPRGPAEHAEGEISGREWTMAGQDHGRLHQAPRPEWGIPDGVQEDLSGQVHHSTLARVIAVPVWWMIQCWWYIDDL